MYKYIGILLLSLFFFPASAQNADSLQSVLKSIPQENKNNPEDTLECGILYYLARWNIVPDSLSVYTSRLEKQSEKKIRELPASHPLQKTFKKYLAFVYNHLGIVNRDKGNLIVSLDYYHKSLKIYEELGTQVWIGVLYNNLANTYNDIGDLDKAINYMERGLYILSKAGDHEEVTMGTVNLGYFYFLKNKFKVALNYYNKALKMAQQNKNSYAEALAWERIGQIYAIDKQFAQAMNCYNTSLSICEKFGHNKIMATTLNNMGDCYRLQNEFLKAKEYSSRALTLSKELGNTKKIRDAALSLKLIYESQGNHKDAFDMYGLYIQMRDSLQNIDARNAELKKKMQNDYEKREIISKREKEGLKKLFEQKQKFYLVLGIIILVLIVVVFLSLNFWYKFLREKESKNLHIELKEQLKEEIKEKENIANSLIQVQEKEREKLAAELNEGVKQLLHNAKLQLQEAKTTDESGHKEAVALLEIAIQDIRMIADKQGSFLEKNKLLKEGLMDLILRAKRGRDIDISLLNYGVDEELLGINKKAAVLRIIQELLNNTIKHSMAKKCYVSIKTANNKIFMAVTDTGVGMDYAKTTVGTGFQNISNKIALLGGRKRVLSSTNVGLKIFIQLPI